MRNNNNDSITETRKITHWLFYAAILEEEAERADPVFSVLDLKQTADYLNTAIDASYAMRNLAGDWEWVCNHLESITLTLAQYEMISSLVIYHAIESRRKIK